MKKSRIISDISKRVLIVEGKCELDRLMDISAREDTTMTRFKTIGDEVYEIEIIDKVGSFFRAGD